LPPGMLQHSPCDRPPTCRQQRSALTSPTAWHTIWSRRYSALGAARARGAPPPPRARAPPRRRRGGGGGARAARAARCCARGIDYQPAKRLGHAQLVVLRPPITTTPRRAATGHRGSSAHTLSPPRLRTATPPTAPARLTLRAYRAELGATGTTGASTGEPRAAGRPAAAPHQPAMSLLTCTPPPHVQRSHGGPAGPDKSAGCRRGSCGAT
jgi:hypothetical protein